MVHENPERTKPVTIFTRNSAVQKIATAAMFFLGIVIGRCSADNKNTVKNVAISFNPAVSNGFNPLLLAAYAPGFLQTLNPDMQDKSVKNIAPEASDAPKFVQTLNPARQNKPVKNIASKAVFLDFCNSVCNGDIKAVKGYLANYKGLLNKKDENGVTALHVAASKGYVDMAKLFLNEKADVNAKGRTGASALEYAVREGQEKIVDLLINAENINLDIKNNLGFTPLQIASFIDEVFIYESLYAANVKAGNIKIKYPETITHVILHADEHNSRKRSADASQRAM